MKKYLETKICPICGLAVQDNYMDFCDICVDDETIDLIVPDSKAA